MALNAEAGIKVDALDVDPLIQYQARGQQRIEAAGDQGEGFALDWHGTTGVGLGFHWQRGYGRRATRVCGSAAIMEAPCRS